MYQIGLQINCHYTEKNNTILETLEDCSWWTPLIKQFCIDANHFEIRCWAGDAAAIETGKHFGKQIENVETEELVYQGDITGDFFKEIINNYLTEQVRIKWFTLILYKDETMLFMSSHYGSEVHLFNLPEDKVLNIESFLEQFPCIGIHTDEMMEDAKNEAYESSGEELSLSKEEIQEIKDFFHKHFN